MDKSRVREDYIRGLLNSVMVKAAHRPPSEIDRILAKQRNRLEEKNTRELRDLLLMNCG